MRRPEMLSPRRERRSPLWYVCYAVLLLVLLFLVCKLWVSANYVIVEVQGPSMLDTLYGGREVRPHFYVGGDILYARLTQTAERGDIVIIDASHNPYFTDDKIIKRLIATEGDSIYAENDVVYLKKAGSETYEPLREDYIKEYVQDSYVMQFGEVTLQEGEIFVMGDNREVSADSRALSVQLRAEDIFGVVPEWNLEPAAGWDAVVAFLVRTCLRTGF